MVLRRIEPVDRRCKKKNRTKVKCRWQTGAKIAITCLRTQPVAAVDPEPVQKMRGTAILTTPALISELPLLGTHRRPLKATYSADRFSVGRRILQHPLAHLGGSAAFCMESVMPEVEIGKPCRERSL